MKTIKVEGIDCYIGINAQDNWNVLSCSKPGYLFFHLTKFPSCYVVLATEEKVDLSILRLCGEICKNHTKYRNFTNLSVDCCKCSNLIRGTDIGEVEYKSKRRIIKLTI